MINCDWMVSTAVEMTKFTWSVADPGFSRGGGREPSRGGVNTPNFPENCMKSKEFGRPGGGACVPHAPPRSANADENMKTVLFHKPASCNATVTFAMESSKYVVIPLEIQRIFFI